jgi:hypothetical protein
MADHPELPGGWLPPQAPTGVPPRQPYQPPTAPPAEQHPQRQPLPVFVKERAQQGTNGLAIAATVCAVASLGLLVLSLGLSFFFSLPLGIAGWICAARASADLNPGQRKTGLVLSIVAVVLSVTAAIVWIVLIAAGFSVEELQHNLEQELERQRQRS